MTAAEFGDDMDDHVMAVVDAWRAHQPNLGLDPRHPHRVESYQKFLAAQERLARLSMLDKTSSA